MKHGFVLLFPSMCSVMQGLSVPSEHLSTCSPLKGSAAHFKMADYFEGNLCLGSEISPPETFESAPTFPQDRYSEVGGWRIYAHLDLNPTTSSADWRCMSVTQRRTLTSQSSITAWAGRG